LQHAAENVAHFGLVVDQPQQRLSSRALQADAENVFGRRIQVGDQQAVVYENDASAQAIEYSFGVVGGGAAIVAGARPAA
jgi:hypothetical protein